MRNSKTSIWNLIRISLFPPNFHCDPIAKVDSKHVALSRTRESFLGLFIKEQRKTPRYNFVPLTIKCSRRVGSFDLDRSFSDLWWTFCNSNLSQYINRWKPSSNKLISGAGNCSGDVILPFVTCYPPSPLCNWFEYFMVIILPCRANFDDSQIDWAQDQLHVRIPFKTEIKLWWPWKIVLRFKYKNSWGNVEIHSGLRTVSISL